MNLLILIGIIIGVLILVGATQRKKLATAFKAQANDVIDKVTDPVKVLKLNISNGKAALNDLVNTAGEIFAEEEATKARISQLKEKIKVLAKQAKALKEDSKLTKAKAKVELLVSYEKELETLQNQLKTIKANREKIEGLVEKQKTSISKAEARLITIKTNLSAANACKSVTKMVSNYEVISMPNIEEETLKEFNAESKKLEYMEDESSVDTDAAVEERFKNL